MIVKRKRGDTKSFEATLTRGGRGVKLTGATVKFLMAPAPGSDGPTVSARVEMVDELKGKVKYTPGADVVGTPGVYRAEFEATYSDGSIETFPNGEWIDVVILDDLNPTEGGASESPSASLSPSASASPSAGP